MRYFLDTEFNGHGGELISLALVRDDLHSLYFTINEGRQGKTYIPWVRSNVIPVLNSVPPLLGFSVRGNHATLATTIADYLKDDSDPLIVTDWPDDIRYFCGAVITAPGEMVNIPRLKFEMVRVDSYPTRLADAVQHNAWWDALALRQKLIDENYWPDPVDNG